MIKNFLILSKPLNETYLPLYQSPKGSEYRRKWFWSAIHVVGGVSGLGDLHSTRFPFPFAGQIYNETLGSVKDSFPQYVRELEGVVDGAEVEFHKVSQLISAQSSANHDFSK